MRSLSIQCVNDHKDFLADGSSSTEDYLHIHGDTDAHKKIYE